MQDQRKLYLYSSTFITLALNMPKLLALRKEGVVARYWHFDLYELSFQILFTFLFCLTVFYINRSKRPLPLSIAVNLLVLAAFTTAGSLVQRRFFQPGFFLTGGYAMRFTISMVLVLLELRITRLLEASKQQAIENERLRNAWLKSQLALLKGQLNPHFFFNAMSSLSAVVGEDPRKAQGYIHHLSKVFRNSIALSDTDMICLKDEVDAVRSYCELLKMRHEEGFRLILDMDGLPPDIRIPPMSLQLLVENALKHNSISIHHPLSIEIKWIDGYLEVRNNLSPVRVAEPGAGIGLANLNQRFNLLLHQDIEIIRNNDFFIVRLPLNGAVKNS